MNEILTRIDGVVTAISGVLYMPWVPLFLIVAGLFFTFRTKLIQIRLRKIAPDMERPYKIPGGVAMGGFSALITTVVFILLFVPNNPVYMGKTASIMFVGWMVIGFILYAISGVQRKAISKADREAAMFGHATHED